MIHNRCEACGKDFYSPDVFDRHRTGDYARPGERKGTRRCMTTQEMKAAGMLRSKQRLWLTEPMPAQATQRRKNTAA